MLNSLPWVGKEWSLCGHWRQSWKDENTQLWGVTQGSRADLQFWHLKYTCGRGIVRIMCSSWIGGIWKGIERFNLSNSHNGKYEKLNRHVGYSQTQDHTRNWELTVEPRYATSWILSKLVKFPFKGQSSPEGGLCFLSWGDVQISSLLFFSFLFLKKNICIFLRERERRRWGGRKGAERESENLKQALHNQCEPNLGFYLTVSEIWPEPKLRVRCLTH